MSQDYPYYSFRVVEHRTDGTTRATYAQDYLEADIIHDTLSHEAKTCPDITHTAIEVRCPAHEWAATSLAFDCALCEEAYFDYLCGEYDARQEIEEPDQLLL